MCFPSKPQIWLNIVALFFVFVSSPFQFCIKAGSSRPLPWQFFSNGAARAPPLPRMEPISMPCSKKKKTDWKETYMFQSMLGAGGQARTQSIKAEIVPVCYKRQHTCPHAQPTSTCCDSEDIFFFFYKWAFYALLSLFCFTKISGVTELEFKFYLIYFEPNVWLKMVLPCHPLLPNWVTADKIFALRALHI